MGQRLNIEILKNRVILANSYYHWSGFSSNAINLTIQIIDNFDYIKKSRVDDYIKNKDLLFAIRLLEETGAGVEDIKKTRELLKDKTMNLKLKSCRDRNEGIIGITKEDIEETRYWEEGRVSIDIEKKTVNFNVMHEYTIKEFKDNYDEEEIKEMDIEKINRDFNNIQFEDIFELKAFIDKSNYREKYCFYNYKNNKYIFLIH